MSHYIVLSGATGVGKTTWSEVLAHHSGFEMAREPQIENVFLRRLHRHRRPRSEDAVASQAEFLLAATRAQIGAQDRGVDLLHDNSIHEIDAIYNEALLEAAILTPPHRAILGSLYRALRASCALPDVVVLTAAEADVVAQRRALRGRATETSTYQRLVDAVETDRGPLWEQLGIPVINLETSHLPPPQPGDPSVKELWHQIHLALGGSSVRRA